ncbi:hypothetical protein yc1106_05088 [Curvularia clavata]|uniref:Clr5 domain-containing protein n=1 Tax=Curvularia clavata TaxID=95742 RepID=A0A9Q9DTI3_CURCL|nr:hypothetical protein yc1106_05088 [Curvularia clavata]
MPKKNHPRISQTKWESHKDTIENLYLSEGKSLKGEGGVIELMKLKGFSASKPQYESQFIRWGFKKKLTRETWHTLGRIIEERDEAGLFSRVYAHGTCLADEKVRKETARYRKCETNRECCLKRELPPGVEVQSDQEDGNQENQYQDEAEETIVSLEAQGTYLDDPQTTDFPTNLLIPEEPWNLESSHNCYQTNNLNNLYNRVFSDHPTPNFHRDTSPHFPHSDTLPLVTPIRRSPSTSFSGIAEFRDIFYIPKNTISLFTDLNKPFFRGFRALFRNNQSKILASINQTKHLLPGEPGQELQRSSVDVVILKQILYLLMNNFAGSDYAAFDTIFEQVRQFSVAHMEDILDALPHLYAAALQQSILTIAIKSNIPVLVSAVLRRGLDINRVTCRFGGRRYTPLGLACKFCSLEIVKILLHAGANPNQTIHQNPSSSPIYILIGLIPWSSGVNGPPIDSGILRYLLEARARIPIRMLESSRFWRCETVLDVYIQYNKLPIDFAGESFSSINIISDFLGFCRAEKVIAVLQSAFQGLTLEEELQGAEQYLKFVFEIASKQGIISLVDYCLESGLTPNLACLYNAIYGNNLVLVERYIQLGVGIHDLFPGGFSLDFGGKGPMRIFPSAVDSALLEGYSFETCPTTPFAEAIRYGRQEIVTLFKSYGPSQAYISPECIRSIILAAAEVGNKDIVQEFLAMGIGKFEVRDPFFPVLVAAATLGGNDDIVELLMMAGVRPNYTSIAAAILTRNARLLELFLNSTNSTESETAIAYLAVRWGDRDILRLLIDAGVSVSGARTALRPLQLRSFRWEIRTPLEQAVRQGDHETARCLLENGADIDGTSPMNNNSPLQEAVQCGHEQFVQYLLDHGADPNDPCALQAAAKKSCKLARAILVSFCQRYPNGYKTFAIPALREAIENKDEILVRMLVGHVDVNMTLYLRDDGFMTRYLPSLLGKGIATGNIKVVQILLDSDGNPNSTVEFSNKGRLNAVLKAISTGNLDMVKLLHNAGANLNFGAILRINRTALQLAVELGNFEIVKFLLEQGVDVNGSPCIWEGGTALQYAAKAGSIRIAEMLIEHGADINAPGSKYLGRTAFEFAAEHGRIDMLLLLFHRDVNILSDGGEQIRRAREFAENNGQIAAKDLVEQLGAEAQRRVFSSSENNFSQGLAYTSGGLGLLGTEWTEYQQRENVHGETAW